MSWLLTKDETWRKVEFHADMSIPKVFLPYEDEKYWVSSLKDVGRGPCDASFIRLYDCM